jgi:dynein heavy chain
VLRVCASGLLLEKLREANRHLGRALKGLEIYLERKRLAFPRFYFLSNDELVSVLSQARTT